MNVNFIQLKGVVRELSAIRIQLERIADAMSREVSPEAEIIGEDDPRDASVSYYDQEREWLRENHPELLDKYDKMAK